MLGMHHNLIVDAIVDRGNVSIYRPRVSADYSSWQKMIGISEIMCSSVCVSWRAVISSQHILSYAFNQSEDPTSSPVSTTAVAAIGIV